MNDIDRLPRYFVEHGDDVFVRDQDMSLVQLQALLARSPEKEPSDLTLSVYAAALRLHLRRENIFGGEIRWNPEKSFAGFAVFSLFLRLAGSGVVEYSLAVKDDLTTIVEVPNTVGEIREPRELSKQQLQMELAFHCSEQGNEVRHGLLLQESLRRYLRKYHEIPTKIEIQSLRYSGDRLVMCAYCEDESGEEELRFLVARDFSTVARLPRVDKARNAVKKLRAGQVERIQARPSPRVNPSRAHSSPIDTRQVADAYSDASWREVFA